jgi:hypothetical protein
METLSMILSYLFENESEKAEILNL